MTYYLLLMLYWYELLYLSMAFLLVWPLVYNPRYTNPGLLTQTDPLLFARQSYTFLKEQTPVYGLFFHFLEALV